jgi:hypothetical protein
MTSTMQRQVLISSSLLNILAISSSILFGSSSAIAVGIGVNSVTTSSVSGTTSSVTVAGTGSPAYSSATNFTLNYAGSTNSITGGTITTGQSFSTSTAIPLSFTINRNTTSPTAGTEIVWSREVSRIGNTRNLASPTPTTETAALSGNNINLGTDNLFGNTGDGNGNNNNIERVDYKSLTGFTASDTVVFPVFERGNPGGHDSFKIAAILGLTGGVPSSYGPLKTVLSADYADSGSGFASVVQRNGSPSADTGISQFLGGVLVRPVTDLGITGGTTIFGYSLFGIDVPDNANLVDFNSFPTDTPSGTGGGIDLVSANIGAVTLSPTAVPFEFNPMSGLLILGGAFFAHKAFKKKKDRA